MGLKGGINVYFFRSKNYIFLRILITISAERKKEF